MLSDHDILKALKDGSIHIDPFDYSLIQPAGPVASRAHKGFTSW